MNVQQGWNNITTWELVLPPSRPSNTHLGWFRSRLQCRSRAEPIAILGSTPELRDLAFEEGFKHIFVFERNASMYRNMSQLRVHQTREQWVKGDWLTQLPQYPNTFGAILSDLTSGNIEYDARPDFYQAIATSLVPTGNFLDKILSHDQPLFGLEETLAYYESAPINLDTVNRFNCEVFFYSGLIEKFGCVDTTAFYEDLRQRTEVPRILRILKELPKITPPGMKWYYGQPWARVSGYCRRSMTLVSEVAEHESSPYARGLRLVTWSRR